jgi:ABC-type glycerol-3-phosphate transport system substrate-binding protein
MGRTNTKIKALTLLLAAMMLAACSNVGNSGEAITDTDRKNAPPTIVAKPAELVIYSTSGWTEEAFNDRFGNAIRQKFPQHTIRYIQKVKGMDYPDLLTAGQPIDIIWESVAAFSKIIQYNVHMDMTDLMKKHNVNIGDIEPSMIDAMRTMSNGEMYALPVVNNTLSLYYNKDIFDKFGVPYPKDGMTWDEMLELNKKLTRTDGGIQYVGLSLSLGHYFDISPLSIVKVDPKTLKPTLQNDKWKTMFSIITRMSEPSGYKEKVLEAKGIPGVNNFVKSKDAAMLAGLANVHVTQDVSALNWDVVTYPIHNEAPNVHPQAYPTYFGVSGISKHKDESMEIIRYLLSDEFQLAMSKTGTLPVVKSDAVRKAFAQDTKFKDKNVKSALYSSFAPIAVQTLYDSMVSTAYNKQLVDFATGKVELNTLLRTSEEEANKEIEAAKLK